MRRLGIVIVGCGKAGRLHARLYQSLMRHFPIEVVGAVEPERRRQRAIRELLPSECEVRRHVPHLCEMLDLSRRILFDICSPTTSHVSNVLEIYRNGGQPSSLLSEKPLADSCRQLEKLKPVLEREKLVVCYHYLQSEVTKFIRHLLCEESLQPVRFRTHFSKDRTRDSLRGRGASSDGTLPHVFKIEIPHQISLAQSLFGNVESVLSATAEDMTASGMTFKKHGKGRVQILHSSGVISEHFSNLQAAVIERRVEVICSDGTVIGGSYSSGSRLVGQVDIRDPRGGVRTFTFDDNPMYEMLKHALLHTDQLSENPCDFRFAERITHTIDSAIAGASNGKGL